MLNVAEPYYNASHYNMYKALHYKADLLIVWATYGP